ncbi:MAG TPA: AarF/UbiB family protein [Candidatus Dormibacteraeota bacterium]|nr:AarF/UbiB family protein [Candidatus Dormibacteraeota bacterium]
MIGTTADAGPPRAHELSSPARGRQIAAVPARHHLWQLIELMALEHLVPFRDHRRPALQAEGIGCDAVADNATKIVLKMLLEDGFFHADLHPGNLFIESTTRIGFIDFGMAGIIDADSRAGLDQLLVAVVHHSGTLAIAG